MPDKKSFPPIAGSLSEVHPLSGFNRCYGRPARLPGTSACRRHPRHAASGSQSPEMAASHNVSIAGHRTTVRLEPVMWDALKSIANEQNRTVDDLISAIEYDRAVSSLTSAIRMYVVRHYAAAPLPNHRLN